MTSMGQRESSKAPNAVTPRRWWTEAARILGLSRAAHAAEAGNGFDFAALRRSLDGLDAKRDAGE